MTQVMKDFLLLQLVFQLGLITNREPSPEELRQLYPLVYIKDELIEVVRRLTGREDTKDLEVRLGALEALQTNTKDTPKDLNEYMERISKQLNPGKLAN